MMPWSVSGRPSSSVGASLEEELRELLRVQRVAAGPLEESLLRFGGEDGPVEEAGDQPCGLLVRERRRPPASSR